MVINKLQKQLELLRDGSLDAVPLLGQAGLGSSRAAEQGELVAQHSCCGECRRPQAQRGLRLPSDFCVTHCSLSTAKGSSVCLDFSFPSGEPKQISSHEQGAKAWDRVHARCRGVAYRSRVLGTLRGLAWAAKDVRWGLAAFFSSFT